MQHVSPADLFIAAAAVADYSPVDYQAQKIKKSDAELSLTLVRNPDINKEVKVAHADLFCIGFAAETEKVSEHALIKLKSKSLDMIIANQVGISDQGFNSDFNTVEIITPNGSKALDRARKTELARKIIHEIAVTFNQQNKHSNVSYISRTKN